jgi:hypothetical protein
MLAEQFAFGHSVGDFSVAKMKAMTAGCAERYGVIRKDQRAESRPRTG